MSAPTRYSYGGDREQFGELYRPTAAARPGTVVLIHGGFWRSRYDLTLQQPMARDLIARGYTVWNLEYRRVGNGGGWPVTPADVAAGLDHLATLDVDTTRVVAVGHSAGGHLAAWAAGRAALPAGGVGAAPRVPLTGVISQAGLVDLAATAEQRLSSGAVLDFLGGSPGQVPDVYGAADPSRQVPLPVPIVCVHAKRDANVPFAQSEDYVAAARAAGGRAELLEAAGDHFTVIDPGHPDWLLTVDALARLMNPAR